MARPRAALPWKQPPLQLAGPSTGARGVDDCEAAPEETLWHEIKKHL